MKGLEQDRLAERTTMGAALDEMLVGELDEQGLQLEEALTRTRTRTLTLTLTLTRCACAARSCGSRRRASPR